ncbi:MAG: NAD-dependent epimerase/dehydratase family protein [Archangium sp.]
MNVIVTGTTGMVGEGVLLECLENPAIAKVLSVSRRSIGRTHPKLEELLVKDFTKVDDAARAKLKGYDACFYCAGKTSLGMSEVDYTQLTYDTPLAFAKTLLEVNPNSSFIHISGRSTDSTEQGKVMWARVKGKAENALLKLPFTHVTNLRPALMKATKGQKNAPGAYAVFGSLLGWIPALQAITLEQLALAMINAAKGKASKGVLEVPDIVALASQPVD